jgi:hypothetical protein
MELDFNDLEGPYGDAHPAARVEHADVLISIRDADDARSYVEHALGPASAEERISIYRASVFDVRDFVQDFGHRVG